MKRFKRVNLCLKPWHKRCILLCAAVAVCAAVLLSLLDIDSVSLSAVVGIGIVSAIGGLLGGVWFCIIYEVFFADNDNRARKP